MWHVLHCILYTLVYIFIYYPMCISKKGKQGTEVYYSILEERDAARASALVDDSHFLLIPSCNHFESWRECFRGEASNCVPCSLGIWGSGSGTMTLAQKVLFLSRTSLKWNATKLLWVLLTSAAFAILNSALVRSGGHRGGCQASLPKPGMLGFWSLD